MCVCYDYIILDLLLIFVLYKINGKLYNKMVKIKYNNVWNVIDLDLNW